MSWAQGAWFKASDRAPLQAARSQRQRDTRALKDSESPSFREDARHDLTERIQAGKMLFDCFNRMATQFGEGEIKWEQIRTSVQPAVDQQVVGWISLARMSMLLAFGKAEAWREPANRLVNPSPQN